MNNPITYTFTELSNPIEIDLSSVQGFYKQNTRPTIRFVIETTGGEYQFSVSTKTRGSTWGKVKTKD